MPDFIQDITFWQWMGFFFVFAICTYNRNAAIVTVALIISFTVYKMGYFV